MTPTVFDCHDGHKANGQNVNYSQADRLPGHPDGSADTRSPRRQHGYSVQAQKSEF